MWDIKECLAYKTQLLCPTKKIENNEKYDVSTFWNGRSRILEISRQVCSGHDSGDRREEDSEDGEEARSLFAVLDIVVVRVQILLDDFGWKDFFKCLELEIIIFWPNSGSL